VVEGRAREAIWREGRWWDEIAMSILDSDWRTRRAARQAPAAADNGESPEPRPVAAAAGRTSRPA
jgi:hypothetical protein